MLTFVLMAVGGLNWGLVALFDFNLVSFLLGNWPTLEKLAYVLVGFSAVYELAIHKKICSHCGKM
jgi:uncharacterized membrane protein YuzA (DUF378 family)